MIFRSHNRKEYDYQRTPVVEKDIIYIQCAWMKPKNQAYKNSGIVDLRSIFCYYFNHLQRV